jgi:hypothetical protein
MDSSHQPPTGNALPSTSHDTVLHAAPHYTSPRNNTALACYPASPTAATRAASATGTDGWRRAIRVPWVSLSVPYKAINPRRTCSGYRIGTGATAFATGLCERLDRQNDLGPLPWSLQIDSVRVQRYHGPVAGSDSRLCLCGRSNSDFAPSCGVLSNHRSRAPWSPREHKTDFLS